MKNFKWGYGIVASLVVGLSSCVMDGEPARHVEYNTRDARIAADHAAPNTAKAQMTAAKGSSKGPVQKSTPGPKRAAAPQLPVIQ